MSDRPSRLRRLAAAPIVRAGLILGLILLLQLPLGAVSGLIEERQARQEEVVAGFRQAWGPAQTVRAPVLAVPYTRPTRAASLAGGHETERGWIELRPRRLSIDARLAPETRRRGLFPAIVYTATLAMEGEFEVPELDQPGQEPMRPDWARAVLVTQASDLRAQPADGTATLAGQPAAQSVETTRGECGGALVAGVALAAPKPGEAIAFRTGLTLRGTQSLAFLPHARRLTVHAEAPWASPGFTGATLPASYDIDAKGFRADWSENGDAAASGWRTLPAREGACLRRGGAEATVFGLDLLEPVPTYQMISRAAKYGTLFLALAFLTYFLFESVARTPIHLAQYGLLGLSVSLFALLLVALAEPLGFAPGYALATAAVMAQASLYTLSVVGSARLAALFATVLGLLFGFLYVVLNLDSLSLLAGAVALFAGLSAVMAATRRLDWNGRTAEA